MAPAEHLRQKGRRKHEGCPFLAYNLFPFLSEQLIVCDLAA